LRGLVVRNGTVTGFPERDPADNLRGVTIERIQATGTTPASPQATTLRSTTASFVAKPVPVKLSRYWPRLRLFFVTCVTFAATQTCNYGVFLASRERHDGPPDGPGHYGRTAQTALSA
jgi:hypothetical protein